MNTTDMMDSLVESLYNRAKRSSVETIHTESNEFVIGYLRSTLTHLLVDLDLSNEQIGILTKKVLG